MFYYFGYGSHMSVVSLRAKGVVPMRSELAMIEGWRLTFNIPGYFPIDGGTGNIELYPTDAVHGVLHTCRDAALATLDRLESAGRLYDRIEASVRTYTGRRVHAYVYVGKPDITDDSCLPSARYLSSLIAGATEMRLDSEYIAKLRAIPTLRCPDCGPFVPPTESRNFTLASLAEHPDHTALFGYVFDMSQARPQHGALRALVGGKDATLLFLKRMEASSGTETFEDVRSGRLSEAQRQHLSAYLHEFAREYRYVGHIDYSETGEGRSAFVLSRAAREESRPDLRLLTDRRTGPIQTILPNVSSQVTAQSVLEEAEQTYRERKNENLGFLSESCGFLPIELPRQSLPPAHAAWDQVVGIMPELCRSLRLRRVLDDLPILPAGPEDLPEEYLLRAAAVLAMLAHAYQYIEPRPAEHLPEPIMKPWDMVRERLGRGPAVLSYIDLIVYNWRLLEPDRTEPRCLDNMRLLIPTVDNNEERIFYLTQVEILAHTSPIIGAVVRAQQAVLTDDREALESELTTIIDCLKRVVRESLLSINPNPGSPYYVDPVIWAKTVAPHAVPFDSSVQGPSGTTSPLFNTLDIFFGRKGYQSFLGREIYNLRGTYPPLWQKFLTALASVSVPEYIQQCGDPNLKGLLQEAFSTYAGENGFLGRHRMKVYGYLQLAFKIGRSVTLGGFRGVFKDRTWDQVDSELELSRVERARSFPESSYHVSVKSIESLQPGTPDGVCHVVLDTSGSGIRYEAGDRCGILPENSDDLVARTLGALGATGEELVFLNREWRAALRLRAGYQNAIAVKLFELLKFGCIRPVTPRVAEALHALTQNELLKEQMLKQATEQWELWDLLMMLRQFGYDPKALWHDTQISNSGLSANAICRVVPPETFRMYSISSVMNRATTSAMQEIHLTVGPLRYETAGSRLSQPYQRLGTASNFLAGAAKRTMPISIIVQHPPRFSLPQNPATPIILLAGGTGISPFRAFLVERMRQINSGPTWLFFGLRSREDFVYQEEFAPYLRLGRLNLRVAFSRDNVSLRYVSDKDGGRFVYEPGTCGYISDLLLADETARSIWDLVKSTDEGGQGAHVYVCGRSSFARSVIDTFRAIFRRFVSTQDGAVSSNTAADDMLSRLVAENRFEQEVFTGESTSTEGMQSFDFSEIAKHNDEANGYWMVLDGKVYDLTEFVRLHPGGTRILYAYCGMDASDGYARVHQGHSEVDAMRDMYCIGVVRTPRLGRASAKIIGPAGLQIVAISTVYRVWVQALSLVVEMQNAFRNDLSLQTAVTTRGEALEPRSPYRLLRAFETQQRFLRNYLDGLLEETLPNLWTVTRGFFTKAEQPLQWMSSVLDELRASEASRFSTAMVEELYRIGGELIGKDIPTDAPAWQRVSAACNTQAVLDTELLVRLKETLRQGVMVFERLGLRTVAEGGPELVNLCAALVTEIREFYCRLRSRLIEEGGWNPELREQDLSGSYLAIRDEMKTLFLSNYWVMEEDTSRKLVFLKRTPVAFGSIVEVIRANDEVIAQIRKEHSSFGIVVDMRQAPLRNDPAFENAMGTLRTAASAHFSRLALLLETAVGVLQANRLGRDDEKRTFATRSEAAAIKFAMGHG